MHCPSATNGEKHPSTLILNSPSGCHKMTSAGNDIINEDYITIR